MKFSSFLAWLDNWCAPMICLGRQPWLGQLFKHKCCGYNKNDTDVSWPKSMVALYVTSQVLTQLSDARILKHLSRQ